MKSGTEKSYTPEEAAENILQIMRVLGDHFLDNQNIFEAEGVFRKVGKTDHIVKLSQAIIDGNKDTIDSLLADYSDIDKSSALKTVRDIPLFQDSQSSANELKAIIYSDKEDDEKAQDFVKYIDKLANSDNLVDKMRAEVFYRYLHLLKECSKYSQKSMMTSSNLAIASIGPALMNWLNIPGMDQVLKSNTFMNVCTHAIDSPDFANSFQEKYGAQMAQWCETKLAQLEEISQGLHQENDQIKRDIQAMSKRLAKYDDLIQAHEKDYKKLKKKEDKQTASEVIVSLKTNKTKDATTIDSDKSKLSGVEAKIQQHTHNVDLLKNYQGTPDTRKKLVFQQPMASEADKEKPKELVKKESKRDLMKRTITRKALK